MTRADLAPALRVVAQSICEECRGQQDEPCPTCRRGAVTLMGRFFGALPQGVSITPAGLAADLRRSGTDG